MRKLKSGFLFLIFLIPLLFNFKILPNNNSTISCYGFNEIFEKYSEELSFSNSLKDLALKGFETERLEISQIKKEDYDTLAEYLMEPEVTKYLVVGKTLKFYNIKQAKNYIEYLDRVHAATFILRLKDNKKPIGMLGFSFFNTADDRVINIGYWIGKDYQHKGYAKEAIPMIVNEAFNNIGNFKIYIDFRTKNIASKKLADDIINYIEKNNSESSKLAVEKFNCFNLDIEEYLIFKKTEKKESEKIVA